MGRHTKDISELVGEAFGPPVAVKRARMAWLGRTPLMPVLAGIGAIGVVAAAFSTQQISLNFAGGDPGSTNAPQACVGCSTEKRDPSASRSQTREQPVKVRFAGRAVKGGFTGAVKIKNDGLQPLRTWKIAFRIPNAAVTGAPGVTFRTSGKAGSWVFFTGAAPLAPGKAVTVMFTARGAYSKPADCKINSLPCW